MSPKAGTATAVTGFFILSYIGKYVLLLYTSFVPQNGQYLVPSGAP